MVKTSQEIRPLNRFNNFDGVYRKRRPRKTQTSKNADLENANHESRKHRPRKRSVFGLHLLVAVKHCIHLLYCCVTDSGAILKCKPYVDFVN